MQKLYQKRAAKLIQEYTAAANEVAQETLSLTTTVRIYGTERKELGRISCNLVTQQHGFGIWLQGGCWARFWQ
nr:abc transporter b family member 26, chloroplastic [Quercus suber]